ncbi:MAG: hypothetical protein BJ554DRAFT_1265 [Olpidium bornovanus]|uniref:RRM domain-containing protein n=1 Tax=Olpidium bornovanus TaxID=278681 RepID=A0A8H8DHC1_9FUNG|nr:MAG: hypothetical protein BJ554DRAFT_1265 [Olpidium bornovanus]
MSAVRRVPAAAAAAAAAATAAAATERAAGRAQTCSGTAAPPFADSRVWATAGAASAATRAALASGRAVAFVGGASRTADAPPGSGREDPREISAAAEREAGGRGARTGAATPRGVPGARRRWRNLRARWSRGGGGGRASPEACPCRPKAAVSLRTPCAAVSGTTTLPTPASRSARQAGLARWTSRLPPPARRAAFSSCRERDQGAAAGADGKPLARQEARQEPVEQPDRVATVALPHTEHSTLRERLGVFIDNLPSQATAEDLGLHFSRFGRIEEVRLYNSSGSTGGYGVVQFQNAAHAQRAAAETNPTEYQCRLAPVQSTPRPFRSSASARGHAARHQPARIVVAHLPFDVTVKELRAYFSAFGEVQYVHLPKQRKGKPPRAYVIVSFSTTEGARKAAAEAHGKELRNHVLYVKVLDDRARRTHADREVTKRATVRVVNLHPRATAERLQGFLGVFGEVEEVVLPVDPADGSACGYALARFVRPVDADTAVREGSGAEFLGRPVIITRSRGGARAGGREAAAAAAAAEVDEAPPAADVRSVYVSNLPKTAGAGDVGGHFRRFGEVAAVHLPPSKLDGLPVGYGFVDFATPEEARAAVEKADGTEFAGRTIRVRLEKTRTAAAGEGYGEGRRRRGSRPPRRETPGPGEDRDARDAAAAAADGGLGGTSRA